MSGRIVFQSATVKAWRYEVCTQSRTRGLALGPTRPVFSGVVNEPDFPNAIPPERQWTVLSLGLRLNLIEWGDPHAPALLLCHGMWDHARSFAVLAPLLARRFRVIAMDARGHGDSDWAPAYSWQTDVLDILNVLRAVRRPVHLIGHSKGGGQAAEAARVATDVVGKLVNIDGFGPAALEDEDQPLTGRCAAFLDKRRRLAQHGEWRPYTSLEELAARRRAQNPRLSLQWLRYFTFHGARHDADGWRWKADPLMASGFGPWRPEWIAPSYATLCVPMLAITGSVPDTWGPLPETVLAERLAQVRHVRRYTVQGAGHFVHIEQPHAVAAAIQDFLCG